MWCGVYSDNIVMNWYNSLKHLHISSSVKKARQFVCYFFFNSGLFDVDFISKKVLFLCGL